MRSLARTVLGFGAPLLLLALLVGGQVGTWLFVAVSPTFPVALIVLGAAGEHRGSPGEPRTRRIVALALILGLSLEIGALGTLILDGNTRFAATWLGLPAATWLMLVALGLVPLALIPWAYAVGFGHPGRDGEDRPGLETDGREP